MRVVGWAVAIVVLFVTAAFVLAAAFGALSTDRSDITDLEVGDCFDLDPADDGSVGVVDVVDCDEPHNAEVVAVADLNPDGDLPYPPDGELFPVAERRCEDVPPDPRFGILAVAPTESTWDGRRGRVVCVALVYGDGRVSERYGRAPDA